MRQAAPRLPEAFDGENALSVSYAEINDETVHPFGIASNRDREKLIKAKFAEQGIKVKFVGRFT